jgi:hypothetical protein
LNQKLNDLNHKSAHSILCLSNKIVEFLKRKYEVLSNTDLQKQYNNDDLSDFNTIENLDFTSFKSPIHSNKDFDTISIQNS